MPTFRSFLVHACSCILLLLASFPKICMSQFNVTYLPGFTGDLPFRFETGYIGVGEADEIQLFYYFIESERDPSNDPIFLWFTGGPGCSGLATILYEIGPLQFDVLSFKYGSVPPLMLREQSWTKVASIIFLDSPVGTGFSYSKTADGYVTSDSLAAKTAYQFIRKWLLDHLKFSENPLYIAGESYGGMFVPMVTKAVSDGNNAGVKPIINLLGYLAGNPVTRLHTDINSRIQYAHRVGLISDNLYEAAKTSCNGVYYVNPDNVNCTKALEVIYECIGDINKLCILEPLCVSTTPKPNAELDKWDRTIIQDDSMDNLLLLPLTEKFWCREFAYMLSYVWANDADVREALHVHNDTVWDWKRCNKSLSYTHDVDNVVDYHRNLSKTDHRALIYSGDHDMAIPYVGTLKWISELNFTVADYWRPWFTSGQVSGYTENLNYNDFLFTFVTVKGAGHTAPEYKPMESFNMLERWLSYYPI